MSKEFFSVLGDELCSIKNSPFYKLGQKNPSLDDPNMLRSHLAYDPDRLFNTDRYERKLEAIEDEDFVEMKQQERHEELRIQFQLLREATREDFDRKVREMRLRSDEQTAPKQFTIFRSPRSFCRVCQKCACYRGNFGRHALPWAPEPSKTVEFLSCLHCRCPMNAHELVRPLPSHRTAVWSFIKSKRMREEYLNVPYFVAGFRAAQGKAEETLLDVAEILEKVGFKLRNYQVASRWKLEMALLRVGLLLQGEDPSAQETTMRLQECIADAGRWTDAVGEEFQEYLQILKKLHAQSHAKMFCRSNQDDPVLLFLIETDSFSSPQQKNLIQSLEEYMQPAKLLYLSSDKREAVLLSQELFPMEFALTTRMFLLPQTDNEQQLLRFRDIMDYNGYSVLFQNVNNIKRITAENMLNFLTYHQLTYVLGKDFASEALPRLPLVFSAKTGPHHLNHYGQLPSYLEVPASKHDQIIKEVFSDYGFGQRCVIVLRPLIAGSGFEEVVVNLLRVNNFTIIQRIRGALSLDSALYLAALEHIGEKEKEEYLSLLTTGVCQVLLVSKKSAIYDAHVLLNSCDRALADINPRWIRDRPSIQIKRGREVFKEQFNFPQIRNNMDLFGGANSLLSINNLLFGGVCEGRVRILQNCRTGQLIRVEEGEEKEGMKATVRQREEILGELKKDNFNYLLFNSKSEKTTEELVSLFFPECTLFESTVVMVKPTYLHLLPEIKQTLAVLRYHLIFSKTVQLSRQFAEELIQDMQKLKMDHETVREATEIYAGQKVAFLCVSKLSARKQLLFLLSNFAFLPSRTILHPEQTEQFLKEVLVPIWNNQERYLKVFNRHLANLQEAAVLLTEEAEGRFTPQDKQELTEYFVGSIFGTRPNAEGKTSIGQLSLYCTETEMAKFQSWYYATLSNYYPNSVPLLFQYRLYGRTTLVVQSYSGEPFMACVVNHYNQEREQQEKSKLSSREGSEEKAKKRNSISLLLWAKKIFKFIEELSKLDAGGMDIPIEVEGWGRIIHHNNQYRAELNETQCIQQDKHFLEGVIAKFAGNRHLLTNCKKMMDSRVLPERYRFENRRLMPKFDSNSIQDSLRVVERGDVSKLYLQGEFQMLDPDNEKNTTTRSLLALNLYRICPQVATRYSLLAQTMLFFDKWQQEALEYREVFAGILEHIHTFIGKYEDLEFLEFEIYMLQLHQLMQGEIPDDRLRAYPNLRKGRARAGEEVVGKNRKFLDQKQYFRPSQQHNEDALEEIRLKYTNFDLKTLDDPQEHHILNIKEDLLHKQWMNQGNIVNLLREDPHHKPVNNEHRGVFVQYEKILNENEEKVKGQLQGQVQKLGNQREETVLRDRGIDDELWYKRVRSGIGKNGKVDDAISKQLQKLSKFKASQSNSHTA